LNILTQTQAIEYLCKKLRANKNVMMGKKQPADEVMDILNRILLSHINLSSG
jgi:hypothetical protein